MAELDARPAFAGAVIDGALHAPDVRPGGGVPDGVRAPDPLALTYLGRSAVLLDLDGVCLLTDPSLPRARRLPWSRRMAPFDPPAVDAVLVSHTHSRHMNVQTLRGLRGSPRIIVPEGAGQRIRGAGVEGVEEVRPGDSVRLGSVIVQAVGAEHGALHGAFGGRPEPVGYVIDGTSRVYFAGDSVPFPEMEHLQGIDLALLPIAPVLRYVGHMSPTAAADIAAIVGPRTVVPIHWGPAWTDEPAPPWLPQPEPYTPENLEAALRRAFAGRGVTADLRVVLPGYSTVIAPPAPPEQRRPLAAAMVARDGRSGRSTRRSGARS